MLKGTLNSSLRLIHTKNLYSDGDELSVVYCIRLRFKALLSVEAVIYDLQLVTVFLGLNGSWSWQQPRWALFYLLDYVTPSEIVQIGDRKKIK